MKKFGPLFVFLLTALSRTCDDLQNNGGVRKLHMIDVADFKSATLGTAAEAYTYVTATTEASALWKDIQFDYNSVEAGFTTAVVGDSKATYQTSRIEGYIPRLSATHLKWLEGMRNSCGVVAAVEYMSGDKILLGWDDKSQEHAAMFIREITGVGGKAPTEGQGATIVFEGTQIEIPHPYSFATPIV